MTLARPVLHVALVRRTLPKLDADLADIVVYVIWAALLLVILHYA